jgi:hypothetical protein
MAKKKLSKLSNFKPDEVSLVPSGANLKTAFIIKNENGDNNMFDELIKKLKDFTFKNEAEVEKALDKICVEKSLGEEQRAILKTALAVLETMGESGLKDLYFSVSEDYASVSVYKSEDLKLIEEVPTLKEEIETLKSEKSEIEKSLEDKVEKSELTSASEKIEKLVELIEDKSAAEKIVKGGESVNVVIPEAVQKQLDAQQAKIEKLEKDKADADAKVAKAESEKIEKAFVEKAEKDMNFIGKSDEVGSLLRKCSESLEEEDYNKLESILKGTNSRIEKGDLFTEFGETGSTEVEGDEKLVDAKAAEIQKKNPELSIQKARIQAREEIAKINKNK